MRSETERGDASGRMSGTGERSRDHRVTTPDVGSTGSCRGGGEFFGCACLSSWAWPGSLVGSMAALASPRLYVTRMRAR